MLSPGRMARGRPLLTAPGNIKCVFTGGGSLGMWQFVDIPSLVCVYVCVWVTVSMCVCVCARARVHACVCV